MELLECNTHSLLGLELDSLAETVSPLIFMTAQMCHPKPCHDSMKVRDRNKILLYQLIDLIQVLFESFCVPTLFLSLSFTVEHYKKKQSRLFDTAVLTNEIKVSGSSKAHDICTKAIHKLKVIL